MHNNTPIVSDAEDLLSAYDSAVSDLRSDEETGWNEGNCRPAMERRIRRLRTLVLRRLTTTEPVKDDAWAMGLANELVSAGYGMMLSAEDTR